MAGNSYNSDLFQSPSAPVSPDDLTNKAYVDTAVGGAGTVTSISVVSANGVSGSVADPTTTPAITIDLDDITPDSVNGVVISGSATPTLAVTGTTTVSGANSGDQTITLTGDVTGIGTGSFPATIANSAVTYAKIQNATAATLLGNPTALAGAPSEITLGSGLSFVGNTLEASGGGGITINNAALAGTALVNNPGTGTSFTIRTLQSARGISITSVGGGVVQVTTSSIDYLTNVNRTNVTATGSGSTATYNLQSLTLSGSALGSSAAILNFQSLLKCDVGTSAGAGVVLRIVMDGTTTVFTLNLTTGLTSFQSFYIDFGFNFYLTASNQGYVMTSAQSTSYTNKGFSGDQQNQVTFLSSFNKAVAHTFQVTIEMDSVDVTVNNYFSTLSNK